MTDYLIKCLSPLFAWLQLALFTLPSCLLVFCLEKWNDPIFRQRLKLSRKRWIDIFIYASVAVVVARIALRDSAEPNSLSKQVVKFAEDLEKSGINYLIIAPLLWLGLIYSLHLLRILPKHWPRQARPLAYYGLYPPLTASLWLGSLLLLTSWYVMPGKQTLAPRHETVEVIIFLWGTTAIVIPLSPWFISQIDKIMRCICNNLLAAAIGKGIFLWTLAWYLSVLAPAIFSDYGSHAAYLMTLLMCYFLYCLDSKSRKKSELESTNAGINPEKITTDKAQKFTSTDKKRNPGDHELIDWLHTETPSQLDKNLFDQDHELKRIQSFFYQSDDTAPRGKRIAIEGPRGIGKSTLAQKLYQKLQEHNEPAGENRIASGRWLYVQVDAWGRSASHIEQQILELILGELAQQIDVFALNYIATRYHEAIKGLDGIGKYLHLANALNASSKEPLDELHSIFTLLNLNLLLVIEDPDRSTSHLSINQLISFIDRLNPIKYPKFNVVINYSLNGDLEGQLQFQTTSPASTKKSPDNQDDPAQTAYAPPQNTASEVPQEERLKLHEMAALTRAVEHNLMLQNINCRDTLERLFNIWLKRLYTAGLLRLLPEPETNDQVEYPAKEWCELNIKTPRDFKRIFRHVDCLWNLDNGFLGEIHLNDLIGYCAIFHLAPLELKKIIRAKHENSILDRETKKLLAQRSVYLTDTEEARTKIEKFNNDRIMEIFNNRLIRSLFAQDTLDTTSPQHIPVRRIQSIFNQLEESIIPERNRFLCLLNERTLLASQSTPKDQEIIKEIIEFFKMGDFNSEPGIKFTHRILTDSYFCSAVMYFIYQISKPHYLNFISTEQITKMHTAIAEQFEREAPEKTQHQILAGIVNILMPQHIMAYLNQSMALFEKNDLIRSAKLLQDFSMAYKNKDKNLSELAHTQKKTIPTADMQNLAENFMNLAITTLTTPKNLQEKIKSINDKITSISEYSGGILSG